MEYKIVSTTGYNSAAERLASQVNRLISEGWVPQGGVCIHADSMVQAMVREKKS